MMSKPTNTRGNSSLMSFAIESSKIEKKDFKIPLTRQPVSVFKKECQEKHKQLQLLREIKDEMETEKKREELTKSVTKEIQLEQAESNFISDSIGNLQINVQNIVLRNERRRKVLEQKKSNLEKLMEKDIEIRRHNKEEAQRQLAERLEEKQKEIKLRALERREMFIKTSIENLRGKIEEIHRPALESIEQEKQELQAYTAFLHENVRKGIPLAVCVANYGDNRNKELVKQLLGFHGCDDGLDDGGLFSEPTSSMPGPRTVEEVRAQQRERNRMAIQRIEENERLDAIVREKAYTRYVEALGNVEALRVEAKRREAAEQERRTQLVPKYEATRKRFLETVKQGAEATSRDIRAHIQSSFKEHKSNIVTFVTEQTLNTIATNSGGDPLKATNFTEMVDATSADFHKRVLQDVYKFQETDEPSSVPEHPKKVIIPTDFRSFMPPFPTARGGNVFDFGPTNFEGDSVGERIPSREVALVSLSEYEAAYASVFKRSTCDTLAAIIPPLAREVSRNLMRMHRTGQTSLPTATVTRPTKQPTSSPQPEQVEGPEHPVTPSPLPTTPIPTPPPSTQPPTSPTLSPEQKKPATPRTHVSKVPAKEEEQTDNKPVVQPSSPAPPTVPPTSPAQHSPQPNTSEVAKPMSPTGGAKAPTRVVFLKAKRVLTTGANFKLTTGGGIGDGSEHDKECNFSLKPTGTEFRWKEGTSPKILGTLEAQTITAVEEGCVGPAATISGNKTECITILTTGGGFALLKTSDQGTHTEWLNSLTTFVEFSKIEQK